MRGDTLPLRRRFRLSALLLLLPLIGFLGAVGAQDSKSDAAPTKVDGSAWKESGQCKACHLESSWRLLKAPPPELFDHATTGFPLRDAHKAAKCATCHRRGLSALTSSCDSCHHDVHGGQNTKTCQRCHTERNWIVPRSFFTHDRTRFPLMGVHAAIACEACHRNARTEAPAITPTECVICHRGDFRQTRFIPTAPDHTFGGLFDRECTRCHLNVLPPITFKGAVFR